MRGLSSKEDSAISRTSAGAICAFGNGNGGLLVLGVDNAGTIVGVREDPERMQERLTSFLQSGCSVPVSARCGRYEDPNGWVHWIDVPRQPRGFEPLHYDGRFWIRRGRASVPPSPTERQELFNDFGFVLTEEQVIRAATVDDIDHHAFRTYLRAQGLDTDEGSTAAAGRRHAKRGDPCEIGWKPASNLVRRDGVRTGPAASSTDIELLHPMRSLRWHRSGPPTSLASRTPRDDWKTKSTVP